MRSGRSGRRVGSRCGLSTRGREWETFVVGGVENQRLCGRGRVRVVGVRHWQFLPVAVALLGSFDRGCCPGRVALRRAHLCEPACVCGYYDPPTQPTGANGNQNNGERLVRWRLQEEGTGCRSTSAAAAADEDPGLR